MMQDDARCGGSPSWPVVRRGDIYGIRKAGDVEGSEQQAGRPGIIVGNDIGNRHSPVAIVAYITSQPKKPMPTHVALHGLPEESVAMCEQIYTVSKSRLTGLAGRATDEEMAGIDHALAVSLGLGQPQPGVGLPGGDALMDAAREHMGAISGLARGIGEARAAMEAGLGIVGALPKAATVALEASDMEALEQLALERMAERVKGMEARLAALIGGPAQAPAEKEGGKRKRLDDGRIKALHDAGWTMARIAAEMGVSVSVISRHLKKMEG